jgi:hypothetical protein
VGGGTDKALVGKNKVSWPPVIGGISSEFSEGCRGVQEKELNTYSGNASEL